LSYGCEQDRKGTADEDKVKGREKEFKELQDFEEFKNDRLFSVENILWRVRSAY
jgi:hypothetical protein